MFQIGEVVAYGATGICTVDSICFTSLNRAGTRRQECYVLRPNATPTCLTYVPTTSPLAGKIRPVLTRQEIDIMLTSVRGQRMDWIEDTRQRADEFGKILSGGLTGDLLKLINCLYQEKKSCSSRGKRFSLADDRLLTSAERMVSEEFSYALNIPPEQVTAYIAEHLE